jgi:hypothetical protein
MRSAVDQGAPGRAARCLRPVLASSLAAAVLAACTLSACTLSAGPGGQGAKPATGPSVPGRPGAGQAGRPGTGPVSFKGGPGGRGSFIIAPGAPGAALLVLPPGGLGSNTGRPRIDVPRVPPASSAEAIPLPLDSYEQVSVQEQEALAAAGDQLTQRCMAAAGFSYPVAAQPGAGGANVAAIEDGGYGVASLAQAETYGYTPAGAGGPLGSLVALPGFLKEQNQHGPAWTSALLGFVPGAKAGAPQHEGCLQAADTALYGSLNSNPDPDPVPGIAIQSAQWTQSDPRILVAEHAWSACMSRSGFGYKTPAQAQGRSWPATPTPEEIATAVADVRCKAQANLVNTWLTVEAAYQQVLISQNLGSLSRLQSSVGALLSRAELLLQLPGAGGILRISQQRLRGGARGGVHVRIVGPGPP